MKSLRTPAFSAAVGLFVPAALALCAPLLLWWCLFCGRPSPETRETLLWTGAALLVAAFVLVAAGLARLLRGAFRIPLAAAAAWALAAAATGLWPLAALLPAARRLGNAAAARRAARGGAALLAAEGLALAGRLAEAPVYWPLLAAVLVGAGLVLASLRALDGASRPQRALAAAFALVVLVSLATQPALHVGRIRRLGDADFAELRKSIGVLASPESFFPGRPPVPESEDPVAALDSDARKAEDASFARLRSMLSHYGTRRHPFLPEELALAAAWFKSHTNRTAVAEAVSVPGYRSCLPGPASFAEIAEGRSLGVREPRFVECFEAYQTLTVRARLEIAAGDVAAAEEDMRRIGTLADLFEDEPDGIGRHLAWTLRAELFFLRARRIDLWSEADLLAMQRDAEGAAEGAADRLRAAFDWDRLYIEGFLERFARTASDGGALRGSGIPEFWAAGERRTSHRNALLSWRAAEDVLRAGPDAVVGPAIDRLREDEEKREKAATPAAGMTFSHVSDWLESDVVAPRDRASVVRAAVAVERYRRANGGVLPPTLDALVPDYLPAVPRAARTGEPLVYEPGPIEIPAETLHVLADSDAAAARSADEFEDCFDDVGPETRTLPPVVLPGFRLVLPSRNEDPEDKRPVDFLFSPAQGAAE